MNNKNLSGTYILSAGVAEQIQVTDREILATLVASLQGADVRFNNQFAVGLQIKGAARMAKVRRLNQEFQEALAAAKARLEAPQSEG